VATTLRALLEDERSTATTTKALVCLDQLFVTPASTGTRLAVDALRTVLPEDTVSAAMTVYAAELRRAVP
jgi:predicted RNase H-like nuclease